MRGREAWHTAPIGEWPIQIIDGDRSSNYPKGDDFVEKGVPFLNTTNIANGVLDLTDLRFVTEAKAATIKKGRLRENDIIMTTRGTIGRVARFKCSYEMALINAQMLIFRTDPVELDPDFLFYVLSSDGVQGALRRFSSGSAQPQIPIRDLRLVPITLPAVDTQRRIAAILRGYDDLIQVNRRRAAVLEEMARSLFEEWFVHFRFPGHESVPFVNTPDGHLPEGWSLSTLGSVFSVVLGGTPARKRAEYWGGTVPWLNSGKANDLRVTSPSEFITEEGLSRSSAKMMPTGTTIIAITGATLGQVSILAEQMCGNQSLVGLWDEEERRNEYAYRYVRSRIQEMVGHASGGAQQHINKPIVERFPYREPPQGLLDRYLQVAQPSGALITKTMIVNERLAASRDFLLPRLISGQLSVEGAERELELAA
jgi:type I restriction enzyme S subunit